MKNIIRSIELPLKEQYAENHGWENSYECYELDTEFRSLEHFLEMEENDLIRLIRKMDNFLEERGISTIFSRNYALVDRAYRIKTTPIEEQEQDSTLY